MKTLFLLLKLPPQGRKSHFEDQGWGTKMWFFIFKKQESFSPKSETFILQLIGLEKAEDFLPFCKNSF